MQIVIDIDEDIYAEIKEEVKTKVNTPYHISYLHEVISVGTPLPKGHGRIVDGDNILIWLIDQGIIGKLKCGEITEVFEWSTIIEADKEDK